ncbi:MAG: GTPase [Evtepia gabavorous]
MRPLGRPNAGKSSLLNALAGYERAIVTPIPGTTRDTVEATVTLEGYLFRLVDTAGLRDSDDPIEQLGVARSRQALDQADLILLVCDGTQELGEEDTALLDQALDQADTLLVMNKSDLPGYGCPMFRAENTAHTLSVVGLSAKTGLGLEFLEAELVRRAQALLPQAGQRASELLLTNQRQTDAVRRAAESVARAGQALEQGVTPDALLTDVEQAMAPWGN